MNFAGVHTAIVTPFANGKVDYKALEKIIEMQISAGVAGIVAVGTTGESPTLHMDEHSAVINFIIKKANKRCIITAGTGGNSTDEAIELTRNAFRDGADASLQVTPYYNKPTQDGLYRHFTAISDAAPELPMILYNVPGRSGVEIAVDTVARLAENPNIPVIKEAGGSVDRVSHIRSLSDITILSGDDALTLPMMSVGAQGVISVISNVMPVEMVKLVQLSAEMNLKEASALHLQLYPLMRDLFVESNPIPVKTLLAEMGLLQEEFRLPMSNIAPANREILLASARSAGLSF
ncbi:MAG: 4-hydroxy-tetrahydrodipicolinate synthase [Lentisphaeraceae bacterium]|nr:4-hydroxy-tetrahydrodipicolinate synthase [Lentisphaeraceae bacterium]